MYLITNIELGYQYRNIDNQSPCMQINMEAIMEAIVNKRRRTSSREISWIFSIFSIFSDIFTCDHYFATKRVQLKCIYGSYCANYSKLGDFSNHGC